MQDGNFDFLIEFLVSASIEDGVCVDRGTIGFDQDFITSTDKIVEALLDDYWT
jgi:hypothetical protein